MKLDSEVHALSLKFLQKKHLTYLKHCTCDILVAVAYTSLATLKVFKIFMENASLKKWRGHHDGTVR